MTARVDAARTRQLAKLHGTPLYAYSAATLRERSAELQDVLAGADLYYSLKANPNTEVSATLRSTGCRVEVASGGELDLALAAGYVGADVLFIGPGKTPAEIIKAAEAGVARFVVDNDHELTILRNETDVRSVALRVNPDFEAKGGKLTMSGGKPKQFGVDRPQVPVFVEYARKLGIKVSGLHYYLGTRFLDAGDIVANTRRIIRDAQEIVERCGLHLEFIDMGGGFGVPYFDNESRLSIDELKSGMQECIHEAKRAFPEAQVAFESGRYLTAEAGQLILEVLATKESYGTSFCVCDGGTNLNLAAIGTGSLGKRNFPNALISRNATSVTREATGPVTVTGPLCTPDDTLLKSVEWDCSPYPGDLVVLSSVGAYGPSASPHSFLGHTYPTEVVV